jgi:hypothetical protein
MNSASFIEFGAFNPRQNLPAAVARKRGESNFVAAFQRDFGAERVGQGIGGRHFAVSGYGIADFVWAELGRQSSHGKSQRQPMLIAFEMKLTNWKRALSQAYRYSYFADEAIVVMPPGEAEIAASHLDIFRALDIGLWMFNAKTADIQPMHMPTRARPRNPAAKAKAVSLFERSTKFRQLAK